MAELPRKKSAREAAEDHAPWKPPAYDNADAAAIQALVQGNATPEQQKRALDWIVNKACGTYDLPYRPGGLDGDRDTSFAIGKQFVGQQIVKLMKLKIGALLPSRGDGK